MQQGVQLLSTGALESLIEELKMWPCEAVEDLNFIPSILKGGKVKTLHPKFWWNFNKKRQMKGSKRKSQNLKFPEIDLVIVDLIPVSKKQ